MKPNYPNLYNLNHHTNRKLLGHCDTQTTPLWIACAHDEWILRKCLHQICIFRCPRSCNFSKKNIIRLQWTLFLDINQAISHLLIPRISTFFKSRKLQRRGLRSDSRSCAFSSITLHKANVFYFRTSTCWLWIFHRH